LQVLEASTTKDPTSPTILTPPSTPVRAPSPSSIFVGDIPIMIFDSSLHDLIGEYNEEYMEEYFDSQEFQEEGRESSSKELEEDEIDKIYIYL
jgi:hypothetical protein